MLNWPIISSGLDLWHTVTSFLVVLLLSPFYFICILLPLNLCIYRYIPLLFQYTWKINSLFCTNIFCRVKPACILLGSFFFKPQLYTPFNRFLIDNFFWRKKLNHTIGNKYLYFHNIYYLVCLLYLLYSVQRKLFGFNKYPWRWFSCLLPL